MSRLVDNDHADIERVTRVCAEGLDNPGFCEENRIRGEKDGRGMQQRPNRNDYISKLLFCFDEKKTKLNLHPSRFGSRKDGSDQS